MTESREDSHSAEYSSRAGFKIVLRDLEQLGPNASPKLWSLDEASKYCKSLAKSHYENFTVASCFLPINIRRHFCHVYAFCRWSDDLADEVSDNQESIQLLAWWRDSLMRCFQGEANHPVMIALKYTVSEFGLELRHFSDLVDAFQQDKTKNRFETDDELASYCDRSANPVGRILLKIAKIDSEATRTWSDSICTGLQLANFCQDIRLDVTRNRFYLPRERSALHGISDSMLSGAHATPELVAGLRDWMELARMKLLAGTPLTELGPSWFRRSVWLFQHGGLSLLDRIAQHSYDVWSSTIEVPRTEKLSLLLRAFWSTWGPNQSIETRRKLLQRSMHKELAT